MIIKKFQGKTEAEAVGNAKKDLGNNVVIMNVRNVKSKGPFSFLRHQVVEVTVALEEETKPQPQPFMDVAAGKNEPDLAPGSITNALKDIILE